MNEEKRKELQEKWAARVANTVLSIDKIDTVWTESHPFVIGPRHVAHASDHHNGFLGEETMKAIPCAERSCRLPYDHPTHKGMVACFLRVTMACTKKEVTDVLMSIKEEMGKDGIEGFAFSNHREITDW